MSENASPEFGPGPRAVSVYGAGDAMDDFPVLKAFQQYIDAEQAKARKRLLAMGVFFGVFTLVVVAIFVVLLVSVSNRNQQLNDRLVEYAMKDRASSAVVVQPPQDTSAVLALTSKIEEMNRKMAEAQAKAQEAVAAAEEKARQAAAAAAAAQPKAPTAEELEIQRLKAQLADEKAKAEAEKRRQREQELEDYRRKHYPEYYAAKEAQTAPKAEPKTPAVQKAGATQEDHDDVDQLIQDIDRILDDAEKQDAQEKKAEEGLDALEPIDYLKSGEEPETEAEAPKAKKPQSTAKPKASAKPRAVAKAKTATPAKKKASAKADKKAKTSAKAKAPEKAEAEEDFDSDSISIGTGDVRTDWGIPD